MKKSLCLALLVLCQSIASAQSHGYVVAGPGGVTYRGRTNSVLYLAVGGEGRVWRGVGIGGEAAYVTPWSEFTQGIGIASVNGFYHFPRRGRIDPFATGGYSFFFRSGHANGMNFGGGANYWFASRLALRGEFRDAVLTTRGPNSHMWSFRFGLSFR